MGFVWVGDEAAGRAYLRMMRRIGAPRSESVDVIRYLDLQRLGDDRHHHGMRRYAAGHYLTELSDAAIDALVR